MGRKELKDCHSTELAPMNCTAEVRLTIVRAEMHSDQLVFLNSFSRPLSFGTYINSIRLLLLRTRKIICTTSNHPFDDRK